MKDQYYGETREEMVKYVPESSRKILEVGCGEANFLARFQGGGRELWGVEPHPESARKALSKIDRVLIEPIESALLTLAGESFDCVVFNDVIEHLVDPWHVLEKVRHDLLSNKGVVVASIPNIRHYTIIKSLLQTGEWNYEEWGLLDRTHLRFFTLSTMKSLFQDAGFELITFESIEITSVPLKLRLLSKFVSKDPEELGVYRYAIVARAI
jgi:2-polyprenyl-3-methyl-5-hydroxy-6-metoxy-1,4-benzoquinol methylase